MPNPLWIVTCAPIHRAHEVVQLADQAQIPHNRLVTVTAPPAAIQANMIPGYVIEYPEPEMNISKWWNFAADWIDEVAEKDGDVEYDVLYMESDARLSAHDVKLLRLALRRYDVGMAGSDWQHALHPHEDDVRHGVGNLHPYRLPGFALMVRGELGVRHDPEMRWWFSDDDFEWSHREKHGTVLVGGANLFHVGTDGLDSPDKQTFAVEDEVKFKTKWNITPHEAGL